MKKTLLAVITGAALCAVFMLFAADQPMKNGSQVRHPNIAEAQKFIELAFDKITAAQKANEFDMRGHAQKAKDFLDQARTELKLAEMVADGHKKEHMHDNQ